MSYINREEAIRLIMEYQGGAMDKPTARKVLDGMDGVEICEDTISRQAAIDALDQIFDRCEEIEAHLPEGDPDRIGYKMFPDYITVWKYLHQLPSAQPNIETLTPEEIAGEISTFSLYSAYQWYNVALQFYGMGYVVCRKENR